MTPGYLSRFVYDAIGFAPVGGPTKANLSSIIAHMNAIIDARVRLASLIQYLAWVATGGNGISSQNIENTSARAYYLITGASATTLTCKYRASMGDVDPNSAGYTFFTLNPDWPGSGGRLLTHNVSIRLPSTGWIKIAGPSMLQRHAGVYYVAVDFPTPISDNDTITFTLANPAGNKWLEHLPGETDDISAAVEFYVGGFRPNYGHPTVIAPFWGVQKRKTFELPGTYSYQLESSGEVFMPADSGLPYWEAVARGPGVDPLDISSGTLGALNVATPNGGATIGSIAGLIFLLVWAGYDRMTVTYWKESSASDALWVGQRISKNWKPNWAGDYGTVNVSEAPGVPFYADGNCRSDGRPLAPNQVDTSATNPFDPEAWDLLAYGIPWLNWQVIPGVPLWKMLRWEPEGLTALCNEHLDPPDGYHPSRQWGMRGGYSTQIVVDGVLVEQRDSEQNYDNPTAYGPMGNQSTTRLTGYGFTAASDVLTKSKIAMGGVDRHLYDGTRYGSVLKQQTMGDRAFDLVVPNIRTDTSDPQPFPGGVFHYGTVTGPNGGSHPWHIELTDQWNTYNRYGTVRAPGTKLTGLTVQSASYDSGRHRMTITFNNRVVTLGSSHPTLPQLEQVNDIACGGTVVAPPNGVRLRNWMAWNATIGSGDYLLKPGDALIPTSGAPSALLNRQFATVSVAPYAGSKQSWIPNTTSLENLDIQTRTYRIPLASAAETISNVTVTRNSGGTNLTVQNATGGPFSVGLAKDVCQYRKAVDGDGNGWAEFRFSHLNATSSDADRILAITVETDADTYTDTLNLKTGSTNYGAYDGNGGTDAENIFSITWPRAVSAVSGTVVYENPATGEETIAALTVISATITHFSSIIAPNNMCVNVTSTTSATVYLPMQHQGARFRVVITMSSGYGGSSDDYFDDYVAIHQGLPSQQFNGEDFEDYGCRGDRCVVQDEQENGQWILAQWFSDLGGTFAGVQFAVADSCVAMPGMGQVWRNGSLWTRGTNFDYWGAAGLIYGITDVSHGDQLNLRMYLANRHAEMLAATVNAYRKTLETMLGQIRWTFSSAEIVGHWEGALERYSFGQVAFLATPIEWEDPTISKTTPDGEYLNFITGAFGLVSPSHYIRSCEMQLAHGPLRSHVLDRLRIAREELGSAQINAKISGLHVVETHWFWGYETDFGTEHPDGIIFNRNVFDSDKGDWWGVGVIAEVDDIQGDLALALLGVKEDGGGGLDAFILHVAGTAGTFEDDHYAVSNVQELAEIYLDNRNSYLAFEIILVPANILGMSLDLLTAGTYEAIADLYNIYSTENITFGGFNGQLALGTSVSRRVEWDEISFGAGKLAASPDLSLFADHGFQHAEIPATT
ncbi:MAG TPA: hypothetical protein PLG73_02425 [Candidatus Sumerlaeota bacterium]|nr:hypothetical protein [Candidatus Sumerlaeota bacterium]